MNRPLDRLDRRILATLQDDGRITIADLARRVNLSKTPCLARVKRLERDGYIAGYVARLDGARLGRGHVAFVQVALDRTASDAFDRFHAGVRAIPEVQSCHMVAGGFDYLLKVRTADIDAYRRILGERINALPGVSQTHTYVVMETVKDEMTVPVDLDGPGPNDS
ncbi:MAG: Lrp/AsnC ligand binding domain-containing protein [Rhodobacterales bacterium]|nr:Lrp/AsnC ligand binding domain-containing protein [Rhodobacterales bacterium]